MSIKYGKGTSASRHIAMVERKPLTKNKTIKGLTFSQKNKAGRNYLGKIVTRGRGGGVARRKRQLQKNHLSGTYRILRLEYDPTRSAWLSLTADSEGNLSYQTAPNKFSGGDWVDVWTKPQEAIEHSPHRYASERTVQRSREDGTVTLPIKHIPSGTTIYNIEVIPGKGPKYCRSAGTGGRVFRTERKGYVHLQLPSGEHRYVPEACTATFGAVSVGNHKLESFGKAGRRRLKGHRPKVRGVAMNPVDHPHGGGEGRSSGGRPSTTPWGKRTHWNPTRRRNKHSDDLLITPRPKKGTVNTTKG
jgi:large subunit ribosomal protein L2